ncbi:hypothetical protein Tco_0174724 [Tanacetum coccineum]
MLAIPNGKHTKVSCAQGCKNLPMGKLSRIGLRQQGIKEDAGANSQVNLKSMVKLSLKEDAKLKCMEFGDQKENQFKPNTSQKWLLFLDILASTNEIVNTAHSVFAASSKDQASTTSYVDDVMFSFFSKLNPIAHQLD